MRVLFAEMLEFDKRHLEGSGRRIGAHIGGADGFQQRHFAERHAGRQRRQPDAVGQGDMDHAAPEEEQRGGGITRGDDLFARLIRSDRRERRQLSQFLIRQPRQQRLFGQFRGLEEIDRAAMAKNHLVFRPFDRGIEQEIVPHVREIAGLVGDRLPLRLGPLDSGHDHRDMIGRQFAEFLGEQAGAGGCHRRDPAKIEDDELRARPRHQLARDIVDIRQRQRAHQFDDADILAMRGEDLLLVRAAAAP